MIYKALKIIFALAFIGAFSLFYFNFWPFWPVPAIFLMYILLMLVVSTNVQYNFFIKAYNNRKDYPGNKVALTFDDGPTENTLKILDVLDQFQVKAAFFCIGHNIEKHPDIFQEILDRGHMVGNHTYSHTRKMGFISTGKIIAEIQKCDLIAEKIAGVKMNLFRPPFGIINPKTKKALEFTGHSVIGWNVRPYDAVTKSKELIIKRITKNLKSGDVILLHDNMEKTTAVLEQLLVILKQRNFTTIRPDILFEIHAYN